MMNSFLPQLLSLVDLFFRFLLVLLSFSDDARPLELLSWSGLAKTRLPFLFVASIAITTPKLLFEADSL